jgi:hypothetical protein
MARLFRAPHLAAAEERLLNRLVRETCSETAATKQYHLRGRTRRALALRKCMLNVCTLPRHFHLCVICTPRRPANRRIRAGAGERLLRRRRENEAAWWENEAARRGGEAASWESEKHAPPLFFSPALVRLLQARKRRQSTTARAPGSLPVSLSASHSKQACSPKPRPAQPFC